MKKGLIIGLVLIISLIYISSSYWIAEEAYVDDIRGQVIRFHVRANSDSERDQELKLKVRDKILRELEPLLEESRTIDESRLIMKTNLNNIKSIAQKALEEEGENHSVDVSLGMEKFPTRKYGSIVFPAGEYEALVVEIGEGKGQNWWCVMFPPLCFVDMIDKTPVYAEDDLMEVLSEKQVNTLKAQKDPPIVLKSKIAELFTKTKSYLATQLARFN